MDKGTNAVNAYTQTTGIYPLESATSRTRFVVPAGGCPAGTTSGIGGAYEAGAASPGRSGTAEFACADEFNWISRLA